MTSSPALLLCGATLSGRHGLQNRIERRALGSRGREAAAAEQVALLRWQQAEALLAAHHLGLGLG